MIFVYACETVGWQSNEEDSAKGDKELRVLVYLCWKAQRIKVRSSDAIFLDD